MSSDIDGAEFGASDVEVLAREPLYRGFFRMELLRYKHRKYAGGWSSVVTRELLYRGQAVGALLYDPVTDRVGLVEQIRPGTLEAESGPWCLEVVAGIMESGETAEAVAWREIQEEAGLVPVSLEYICEYYPSPGGCDEHMHLYCGLASLAGVDGELHGLDSEEEDIRLLTFPVEEVFGALYSGRFNNAATLIALQWLQLNIQRLRAQGLPE
ncbi:MAG: NUDIX domain-containing protein [Gammaproteobacteria bacterium]|nr:NUDIX domain-containing protein [Gammaproteobacteria bacterium]